MTESDPAQEMVLASRGVRPVVLRAKEPGRATIAFLRELKEAVQSIAKENVRRVNR
jgi:hypothetical protein